MAKKDAEPPEGEEAGADGGPATVRLADHPRAAASIPRWRAWGTLIGFLVAAWFGNKAGLPFVDLVVRSILIGFAAGLVVWAGSIAIWRQIVFAEIAIRRREAARAQQELIDAIEGEQGKGDAPPGLR